MITKHLQVENQSYAIKQMEENINSLEEYDQRNNLEITMIPDDAEEQNLEEKGIEILDKIDVNVSTEDTEACDRIGKSKHFSKTIMQFVNTKLAKNPLSIEKFSKISIDHQFLVVLKILFQTLFFRD